MYGPIACPLEAQSIEKEFLTMPHMENPLLKCPQVPRPQCFFKNTLGDPVLDWSAACGEEHGGKNASITPPYPSSFESGPVEMSSMVLSFGFLILFPIE